MIMLLSFTLSKQKDGNMNNTKAEIFKLLKEL